METDKQLYEVFTVWPEAFYELLDLTANSPITARSEALKQIETSIDFVIEPRRRSEPLVIAEFQGYRDKEFLPKVMIRCGLVRVKHTSRAIRRHIVYLSKEAECAAVDDGGMFRPEVHYLPELCAELEKRDPDSPVLSVLYPSLEPSDEELTRRAASRYSELKTSPRLDSAHRQKWLDVLQSWVMHRLKLETEDFLKMIVHLPDTEETVWGQQLKTRWTNEGKIEGELAGEIQTLEALQRRLDELLAAEKLPSAAHSILSTENEEKLAQLRRKARELHSKD